MALFRTSSSQDPNGQLLQNRFEQLREDQAMRLQRYFNFTSEYERARDHNVDGPVSDYGRRSEHVMPQRHDIPLPYAHAIVMKHTYRIAGRLPDLVAERVDSSRYQLYRADAVEKILYSIYASSGAEQAFADGAHDGSLLGPACFQTYWDMAADQPRFRSVNPRNILVVPGLDDPHDFQEAFYFWQVPLTVFREQYGDQALPGGGTGLDVDADENGHTVTVCDRVGKISRTRFAGGRILKESPHNYGFVPYIVIPNLGPYREIWGYSDYEFFRHVAAYYEALMSRQADVIRATANGAYTESNTGQAPGKVKDVIAKGGILPTRKDGKVEPIVPGEFGTGFVEHISMIRDAINDLGFTPPASWGTLGAASGSDRALQLAPQVELTALKQINWSAGLKRLNSMLLQMVCKQSIGKSTFKGQKTRGAVVTPFTITLNAAADENYSLVDKDGNPELDAYGQPIVLPTNPEKLIDGNYCTQVIWERRLDRDDPQFILTELNKFAQGAQSLRRTLENFGIESPEEEMRLIEDEADRFPWLRSGMIALITAQIAAQNAQGGADSTTGQPAPAGGGDLVGGLMSMIGGGGGGSGALSTDGATRGINGSSNGGGQSAGAPSGQPYGGA